MRQRTDLTIRINTPTVRLEGMLVVPEHAQGVVLFAHGSGSGRFSPRNQFVANMLQEGDLGTLLIDLLELSESQDRSKVFDIGLLADRLLSATEWLRMDALTNDLPIGYFGASTGAAAALRAAAQHPRAVKAVVSRGGRPDLAIGYLEEVTAPTLLIVGGDDHPVIGLNQGAYEALGGPKQLVVVPGATHLFEEPGTLAEVGELAKDWFRRYLTVQARPAI